MATTKDEQFVKQQKKLIDSKARQLMKKWNKLKRVRK